MDSKAIIFDLDGTLIDSSTSILESFNSAFLSCSISLKAPLNSDIIGPPLMKILEILSGTSDQKILTNLATEFKSHYDSYGYKKTIVFPGVISMLKELKNIGFDLFIATNKRIYPTNKIINMLQWNKYFSGIYGLDSISPRADSKGNLLSYIIESNFLNKDNLIYIGDRDDDRIASIDADIDFIFAIWGYEENNHLFIHEERAVSPNDLILKLMEWANRSMPNQ
jgi:phosphoglycolate phosphatase